MAKQAKTESNPKLTKKGKEPLKRGRKEKKAEDKQRYTIGSFKFTRSEKAAYDALYKASGMGNQTDFFRKVIFEGGLKLYYFDKNTSLIYEKLGDIQNQMEKIGVNFNQVTARINTHASEKNLFSSLNELTMLMRKNEGEIKRILALMESLIEHSDAVREEERRQTRVYKGEDLPWYFPRAYSSY